MRPRILWRWAVLAGIVLVLFAVLWVPRISAERYREPIRSGLENALGRKVKLGTIRFRLLPVPGFTIKDVTIGEDPAIGPEPIAYITTLRARPALSSLFGGGLAFASVDLEDTSVNLTRVESADASVRWNFPALMRPKLLAAFPSVHMVGGRVNFKFGDTKSIFYLLNTDVDLWPPDRENGPWTVKVRAEPARTDRPSRGFANFTARGQWQPGENTITLDAKLEKSELGDMVTLFQGYESNLHGHISGSAHLAGPMRRVGIAGRMNIDEIHGWNQTPPGGAAWPLEISGAVDFPGQYIDLRATIAGQKRSALDLRYHVADYLGRPRWGVNTIFSGFPVAPMGVIARNLGWAVPHDIRLEGSVEGAVEYASSGGAPNMTGHVAIASPAVGFPGTPPLKISPVSLEFVGSTVTIPPSTMTNSTNESAEVEGMWDAATRSLELSISSSGMSIASLRRQAGAVGVPLLSNALSGNWSGNLKYSGGRWTGEASLSDALLAFEAFSEPVRIASADVTLHEGDVSMKRVAFSVGEVEGVGDYSYQADAPRPHGFRVLLTKATGAEVERLLMPALHRGTFLNYAFNFGRVPEPGWLQAMHADGTVQIAQMRAGEMNFRKVKARVVWDGAEVRFSPFEATAGDAVFTGVASVNLAEREPAYTASGRLTGFSWRNGTVSAEGTLETSGTGTDLLAGLTAKGSLRGRRIAGWDSVTGCFDLARGANLRITDLVATGSSEVSLGEAETKNPGELTVQMDGKPRPVVIRLR